MTLKQLTVCSRVDAEAKLKGIHDVTALISIFSPPTSPWASVTSMGCEPVPGFDKFQGPKLALSFDDITSHRDGYSTPMAAHVQEALVWAKTNLTTADHLLVHCMQGASRSAAIAYVILCLAFGPGKESEAQEMLLASSRLISPNMRIIKLGDSILKRDGVMVRLWEGWAERQRSTGLYGGG